jgi:hypothetical protein
MYEYLPARNKLEVVARISAITNSGPESLGPGSKERKSVVLNLAKGFQVPVNENDTKQEIARKIANFFGKQWTSDCESVGQTLTLKGLNLLLEIGTRNANKLNLIIKTEEFTLTQEVKALDDVISVKTPRKMFGETAIKEMKAAEYSKWRLTEWQGMYFEFKIIPELINTYGGGPRRIERTEFDYGLNRTWDLKVHSSSLINKKNANNGCQLNDGFSMETAIRDSGLGLIILSGVPEYDMEFTKWFKNFRESKSKTLPKKPLKKTFTPSTIDYYFIPNFDRFSEALAKKELSVFKQGPQQSGDKRNYKYSINLRKAENSDLLVRTTVLK